MHLSTGSEVVLYRTEAEHTHNQSENKSKENVKPEVTLEIQKLVDDDNKIKPKKILELLAKKNMQPTKQQIKNILAGIRNAKFGPTTISLGELEKLLMENKIAPAEETQSFVISYDIMYEEQQFRFFVSSKTLLKNALRVKHLHADATYKLVWQGFPVIVLGSTDMDRSFHCFGISVCSGETTSDYKFCFESLRHGIKVILSENFLPKTLVADGAPAIKNAFRNVFGDDCLVVMCWFHVRKNIQKMLNQLIINEEKKAEILSDIEFMQLSKSNEEFNTASLLFKKKWEGYNQNFIQYFENEWLKENRFWYEGAKGLIPSTNNALESFNRVIKEK